MNTITTEDVSNWMREQLTKAHEISDYACVTVHINQYKEMADYAKTRFSVYLGEQYGPTIECYLMEDCFVQAAKQTPQSRAEKLRGEAAELLKQAEELDAFTETQAASL